MKRSIAVLLFITLFSLNGLYAQAPTRPYREHLRYFENTPNELNVYKLFGRFDGKTIFILGGIQGDEPGGYLSADLYPNLVLERGNLIVIPRANFHSIINNQRLVTKDMNRRFQDNGDREVEDQIVAIIKQEMAEADLFLNLHDGWGFYSETYVDENRNPKRFGQSVIADASVYIADGDTLQLEEISRKVLERVNQKIEDPLHHLHFMNTNTFDENTEFPEMRKSATYYALTQYGIPAFGVESSKNLQNLDLKIRYHNYVINEFMKLLGVEPEHPAVIYEPPRLIYILVSVNNSTPIVVDSNSGLDLIPGDRIQVTHIESNYTRGLTCDIRGFGNEQDFMRPVNITNPTSIIVKKDNLEIGKIQVGLKELDYSMMVYIFEVNGEKRSILHGQTLELKNSDQFKILNIALDKIDPAFVQVNLKGYVPSIDYNTGEDRNYLITASELTWTKYSVYGEGKIFPITVSNGGNELSRCFISINNR